jgi:hypothetical protein
VVAADSKGSSGGRDGGDSRYPSLLFFCYNCGWRFYLTSVELHGWNSNKGNIAIFPLSQGIYPTGDRIYPKHRETSIELETVVVAQVNREINGIYHTGSYL